MARVLISTFGSSGDLNPYLAIAQILKARGHDPVIATLDAYGPRILRRGFGFRAVRPRIEPDPAIVAKIMEPTKGMAFLVREVLIKQLREAYQDLGAAADELRPDLLLTHPCSFAGGLVAETRDLPWISSILAPISLFSADDPSAFERAPWLLPAQRRFKPVTKLLLTLGRRLTDPWMAPYHALRAELGLAKAASPLFEGLWSPQGVLALYSPILGAPQLDWPANVAVTGFPVDDGGAMDGAPLGMPPDLRQFLDAGPPPLVFALGSAAAFRPGNFFDVAAAAARDLGRRAVLVLGEAPQTHIAGGGDLFVCRSAPAFAELFPRAAVVIHQGGVGTLARALASGKPSLVVPFAFDQPDNAARAVRLGGALSIPRHRWTRARAVKQLRRLLDDPAFTHAAARIGAAIRAEAGAAGAVDVIERRLTERNARCTAPKVTLFDEPTSAPLEKRTKSR